MHFKEGNTVDNIPFVYVSSGSVNRVCKQIKSWCSVEDTKRPVIFLSSALYSSCKIDSAVETLTDCKSIDHVVSEISALCKDDIEVAVWSKICPLLCCSGSFDGPCSHVFSLSTKEIERMKMMKTEITGLRPFDLDVFNIIEERFLAYLKQNDFKDCTFFTGARLHGNPNCYLIAAKIQQRFPDFFVEIVDEASDYKQIRICE